MHEIRKNLQHVSKFMTNQQQVIDAETVCGTGKRR